MQLGVPVEVEGEGSNKRARGRPANVGHFHKDCGPNHFIKVLFASGLGKLQIPDGFREYLGSLPRKMIVRTYTGCSWEIKVKEVDGKAVLDQGWPAFAIAHNLQVGYFLTFKKLNDDEYRVVIFDYSCCEVVTKCPDHGDATRRIVEE